MARVSLKRRVNAAIPAAVQERRASPPPLTGPPVAGDRLLTAPAFVLSSVRSGSTLLRVLLNTHSQIHAPHELHLRNIWVKTRHHNTEWALHEMDLDRVQLTYLLWDRLLHRQLERSGKRILVNKTPSDVFIVDRIRECWPDARLIFLLRHPVAIMRSRAKMATFDADANAARVLRYCEAVEKARTRFEGLTVRYEDMASDPAAETKRLCEFLGVAWEPSMLEYGEGDHGRFRRGIGDFSDKLKSGQVQAPPPPPPASEVPEPLRPIAAAWGYLPT
jgi:Sulfotransferase family